MQPSPHLVPFRLTLLVVAAVAALGMGGEIPFSAPLLWPEEQRAFVQDGPGLLLSAAELERLANLDATARGEYVARFLGRDPLPGTPANELAEGIRRRRELARREFLGFLDARAQLLFLRGAPAERLTIDCLETFKPLEIWAYDTPEGRRQLVLYREKADEPWRLWLPIDSKRRLYNPEMEYYLEQWEEMRDRMFGVRRFDKQICDETELIDEATGVVGLFGFEPDRPQNDELQAFLAPPRDLAAWAREAAATELAPAAELPGELELAFPERQGLRLLAQALIKLPGSAGLEPYREGEKSELRFAIEGQLEREAKVFSRFRLRFQLPIDEEQLGLPVALQVNRRLRPGFDFLMRLKVVEETSGRELYLNRGFAVPSVPDHEPAPIDEMAILALGQELDQKRIAGRDSLVLIPPDSDVVFGLWRAEALVTGSGIEKVVFFVDGQQVMSRKRPPFSAELRLATYPVEQVVRAEGYDEHGQLLAADEVVLNQPRGQLQVRVLDPPRGLQLTSGSVKARVEIVVPEEKRVVEVQFLVNEELQARVEKPPWEAEVTVPPASDLTYLTVTAELDDGSRAEAVRFLNAPEFLEELDVKLIELYTTVNDRDGRLARGLEASDFEVFEDGRRQEIAKFELVDDLPLTLGVTIDTSGSMFESLGQAQRAAIDFLENIITLRDRAFAFSFSDKPVLLMPRTSDVGAVAERLEDLFASGATSLHDAIVASLYYFRGVRGRRALVLLSDGEDTSSSLQFAEALEYARRSGVSIYTIGLRIGMTEVGVRRKLENLAQETGGRTFYIKEAAELHGVYDEIESELRSQYLVAYSPDRPPDGTAAYRQVEVKVRGGKLKARTIRGYYP